MFNVTALKKYYPNEMEGRTEPTPEPVIDTLGKTRYIVEEILSHRSRGRRTRYLVKWKGYTDATWEPEEYLQNEEGEDLIPLKKYKEFLSGR